MARPTDPRIALLLALLDEGYDRKAWHGPNLKGSIRLVDVGTAVWQPASNRKSIWDHVVHAAYWKYTIRRRISGEPRGSFPIKGTNWFARPDPNVHNEDWEQAWKADVAMLEDIHQSLRAAVAAFPAGKLDTVVKGGTWTFAFTIRGAAMHDVYHASQIQLLKKLAASG